MGWHFSADKHQHPDFKTKKQAPRGPVVLDVDHPLYSALDELYLPINDRMIGLKSNEFAATTGAVPGIDDIGRHIDRDDADAIDAGLAPHVNTDGYNLSVVQYYSTTDSNHSIVARRDGASGTPQWQFAVFTTGNAIEWRIGSTITNIVSGSIPGKWYDGKPHVVGLSVDGSTGYLYRDGIDEGSASVSGTAGSTDINIGIGNRWQSYPTTGFGMNDGQIYLTMFFNRALTDFEQKSLSDDPFQLLKPVVPLQYYTPSAVSGANPKGPLGMPIRGPFGGPI